MTADDLSEIHIRAEARPTSREELVRLQNELAELRPAPWHPDSAHLVVAACFVVFQRGLSGPGAEGDSAWVAAVAVSNSGVVGSALVTGRARAGYEAGLLYLREGPLLEAAVTKLPTSPGVLLVNATGLDHPRTAGMALHLGALLGVPTVGVTHRPLCSEGAWPAHETGATSPLILHGAVVGYWLRTRRGARPLAVHAGWRTSAEVAVDLMLSATGKHRTPVPLRLARQAARSARAAGRA